MQATACKCLQAVTKYTVPATALSIDNCVKTDSSSEINVRDAFVAGPGCVLIAADYSQIELRVLAHLSGDPKLIQILRQAGVRGDAFALIANTWLRRPRDRGDSQSSSMQHTKESTVVCHKSIVLPSFICIMHLTTQPTLILESSLAQQMETHHGLLNNPNLSHDHTLWIVSWSVANMSASILRPDPT